MEKCLIVGGYAIRNIEWLRSVCEEFDYIIAADSGYKVLKNASIDFDIAIGDFDSLGYIPEDVDVKKLKIEKDDTDTLSAVKFAIDKGASEIVILGGIGGRLDHTIANIQTLKFIAEHRASAKLIDEENTVSALFPGKYELKKMQGYSLSVFSLTDKVSGLCEKGVKFPLDNAVITNGFPLGVSNEITEKYAEISFKDGFLLVCVSKL